VKLDEETYVSYVRSAEQSRLSNSVEHSKLLCLRTVKSSADVRRYAHLDTLAAPPDRS